MKPTLIVAAALLALGSAALAGEAAPKREVLQKHDLSAPGTEGVMARVTIPPGVSEGRHTHPAELFGYVVEGTLTFEAEGQAPLTLGPGSSFHLQPGKIHEGKNLGTTPVTAVVVFVAEKGKPLATPAK